MPFTSITTDEIAIGRPVKQSLFNKVRENFDELNSRTELAGTIALNEIITGFVPDNEIIDIKKVNGDLSISTCEIKVVDTFADSAEATDFVELDLLTATTPDVNAMTSIFTTTPRIRAVTTATQRAPVFMTNTISSGSYLMIKIVSWFADVKALHIFVR